MASGRVGGTRSKKSGQVGDTIYQVVKNPDGSYTQIVYGKPEDVTQTITPRLQAQRMCMSMVEALMRDLKEVGRISMQAYANKSKSLNAFSSFNTQLVANDCKSNWYGGGKFHYPPTDFIGSMHEQIGGAWMLSSGTWQFNGFDSLLYKYSPIDLFPYRQYILSEFVGMRFTMLSGPETVDHFLRRHYMTVLDSLVFVAFQTEAIQDPESGDIDEATKYVYFIATINTSIPSDTIITEQVLKDLFVCKSSFDVFKMMSDDGKGFYMGLMTDNEQDIYRVQSYGGFTISYMEGKKKISSSSMTLVQENFDNYLYNYCPADIFGTWMGEPRIKPYPSPFI